MWPDSQACSVRLLQEGVQGCIVQRRSCAAAHMAAADSHAHASAHASAQPSVVLGIDGHYRQHCAIRQSIVTDTRRVCQLHIEKGAGRSGR